LPKLYHVKCREWLFPPRGFLGLAEKALFPPPLGREKPPPTPVAAKSPPGGVSNFEKFGEEVSI